MTPSDLPPEQANQVILMGVDHGPHVVKNRQKLANGHLSEEAKEVKSPKMEPAPGGADERATRVTEDYAAIGGSTPQRQPFSEQL